VKKHILQWLFLISVWWEDSGKYLAIIFSFIVFIVILKYCSIYYGREFDYYFRVVLFGCFIIVVFFRIIGSIVKLFFKEPQSSGKSDKAPKWAKKMQTSEFVSKVEVKKLTDDVIDGEF